MLRMGKPPRDSGSYDEAIRYYRNARGLLARCRVEDGFYADMKPVQEAFGTAWLAIDKAIKAALVERGISPKAMPRSWDGLREAVAKHLAVRNGKLMSVLNRAYLSVHLGGYYWGDMQTPEMGRSAMDIARRVIEVLSGRAVSR